MKNVKEFCKKYNKEMVLIGFLIGGTILGATATNYVWKSRKLFDYTGKSVLTWIPNGTFMNLERAKEILDLNSNNDEVLAIFKNSVGEYNCLLISDNVVL